MEVKETCVKCGFDAKAVSLCPVLKTHHALLTKSLFSVSRVPIAEVEGKSVDGELTSSHRSTSEDVLHSLYRRSYVVMTSLLSQTSELGRKQCMLKVGEFDSQPTFQTWSTLATSDFGPVSQENNMKPSTKPNDYVTPRLSKDKENAKIKKSALCIALDSSDPSEATRRKLRVDRFSMPKKSSTSENYSSRAVDSNTGTSMIPQGSNKIVGTSRILEKTYSRLQETPTSAEVRPLHVLIEAFAFVQGKAKTMSEQKNKDYLNEQLKSIRQDISIQQIEDFFAIEVYEAQARLSLELFDHVEFNQCQSRLQSLYEKAKKCNTFGPCALKNFSEFRNYRILYSAIMQNDFALTADISILAHSMDKDSELQYTMKLVQAVTANIPALIFRFFAQSLSISYGYWIRCLLRKLFQIRRSRWSINLLAICGPNEKMSIETFTHLLGFHLDTEEWDQDDTSVPNSCIQRALEFLKSMSVTISSNNMERSINSLSSGLLNCREAAISISDYLSYVHTRSDAKHAVGKSEIL